MELPTLTAIRKLLLQALYEYHMGESTHRDFAHLVEHVVDWLVETLPRDAHDDEVTDYMDRCDFAVATVLRALMSERLVQVERDPVMGRVEWLALTPEGFAAAEGRGGQA